MSRENLAKLLKSAAKDEQLKARLEGTDSYDSLKSLAKERGLDISDVKEEDAATVVCVAGSKELSEDELQKVAGGFTATDDLWRNSKGFLLEISGILPDMDAPRWTRTPQAIGNANLTVNQAK